MAGFRCGRRRRGSINDLKYIYVPLLSNERYQLLRFDCIRGCRGTAAVEIIGSTSSSLSPVVSLAPRPRRGLAIRALEPQLPPPVTFARSVATALSYFLEIESTRACDSRSWSSRLETRSFFVVNFRSTEARSFFWLEF